MTIKKPFLSIIIPLYNEQIRLKKLIKIYKYLNQQRFYYEVILVDDGSEDNTVKQLFRLSKRFRFQLITYQKNKGKGFAIKTGMLASKGRFRLFIDIDLSTPIEEFNKFIPYLLKHDVLIGSRKMAGSDMKKKQSFLRAALGKGFTKLSQVILGVKVSDFTCGFKCFSEMAGKEIFGRQRIKRWGFDSEILFIAKSRGFKIKEVPIEWRDDPNTKVKFPQDIIKSLMDLYKIRYYNFKKRYD